MTTFITINRKSVRIELSEKEAETRANRIRYAMSLKDKEIMAKEADMKRRGYCPKCHLVLPLTKYCSRCQTTYGKEVR